MIIDNKEDLHKLSRWDAWCIHPIYLDNRYHPAENRISCLYLVNTIQWDSCIIPIEHTEKTEDLRLEDIFDYFSEEDVDLYVYDKKSMLNHVGDYKHMFDLELLYYLNDDAWVYKEQFNDYYHRWKKFTKINTIIPISVIYDRLDKFYYGKTEEFAWLTRYRQIKNKTSYENYDKVLYTLGEIEANGLYKDDSLVYTQYHIYTTTGRPSNSFGGTNYAALNKSDDTREHYTSRYEGGRLYLYDYQAFHPTILSNYLKIARPEGISVHEWLGCKYFDVDELSEKQYKESKKKTFFYLYGMDELHDDVKDITFFKKVAKLKRIFSEMDEIETPIFKRKMNVKGLEVSKKFNYFLQCFETEINYVKMDLLNDYLRDKDASLVLYTYDSFLIDFNESEESEEVLEGISNILQKGNFSVTVEVGENFKDMKSL